MPTIDEKLAQLRATGIGEDVIAKMLTLPEKVKEEADKLGVTFKEIADEEVVLLADTGNLDDADVVEINGRTFKAFGPPKPKAAPVDPMADPMLDDTEPDPLDPNEPAEMAAGEPPEDDSGVDVQGIADAIGAVVAQQVLTALAPALDLEKKLMGVLDGIKAGASASVPLMATKEAGEHPYLAMVQQQPQINQQLVDALTMLASEVKGVKVRTTEQTTEAAKEVADLKAQITQAQQRLKELEGDVPVGVQQMFGMRASDDPATVVNTKAATERGPQPVQQPPTEQNGHGPQFFDDFLSTIVRGQPLK